MSVAKPPSDDDAADFLGLSRTEEPASESHPILTAEEVASARDKARKRIESERRAAAMRQVEEEETRRLRREEGLTTGITDEDQLLWITIDLPEEAPWVAINGEPYHHGHSYQVPRHVYRTLVEQLQRSWEAHDLADGKSRADVYKSRRSTVINGKNGTVDNAPRRFDA